MTDHLQQQINQARAAQEQLDRQRRVEARAAALPALLEQQAREQQQAQARAQFEATLPLIRFELGTLDARAGAFRERFAELQRLAADLQTEYAEITAGRIRLQGELATAARALDRAYNFQTQHHAEAAQLAEALNRFNVFLPADTIWEDKNRYGLPGLISGELKPPVGLRGVR